MEARKEAEGLADKMRTLEIGFMAEFWAVLMERFNKSSKILQSEKLDLNAAVKILVSLREYVATLRPKFHEFEERGRLRSGVNVYKEERCRKRRRNPIYDDGIAKDAVLTASDRFEIDQFLCIIDNIDTALKKRMEAYCQVCDKFGFLSNMTKMKPNELSAASKRLVHFYPDDLEDSLTDDLIQFSSYLMSEMDKAIILECSIELFIYRMLSQHGLCEAFPNLNITLRIYLCLMVSNCTGERSFSKLKRIKSELRSTMTESRLNMLSLMSIEHDLLRKIDFRETIEEFRNRKSRKVKV